MRFKQSEIISKRKSRTFYMNPININYSFKTLENLAYKLGATLENGDILVVDNKQGTKRKAFLKNRNGALIIYGGVSDSNKFIPLSNRNGEVLFKRDMSIIDNFK